MRIVFFGTPKEGARILEELLGARHEVVAVVTQPDRPRGRGLAVESSPVKGAALQAGLPVLQPETLRGGDFMKSFSELRPDVGVVVAYGMIIPKEILEVPKFGFVNIHASLLPKYRGAAPIQRALINGDAETGVTIFKLAETLDTGDIIAQGNIKIRDSDTYESLSKELFDLGGELILKALEDIKNNKAKFTAQDDSKATYAPKISKEIGAIDWRKSSKEISCLIRALAPSPAAHTYFRKKLLKILLADHNMPDGHTEFKEPGAVIDLVKNLGFVVHTGGGPLLILEVQIEGGRRMSAWDFLSGHRIQIGEVLPS